MSDPYADPLMPAGSAPDSPREERRGATRWVLRDARATLSWPGESGPVASAVRVRDISGTGAAVLSADAPSVGRGAQLRLHGEAAGREPIEATTIAVSPDPSGTLLVRLRFTRWIALDAILERHRERRMWERYPARESRATLTWRDGPTEQTIRGDLLNISGGGVAFVGDDLPPAGMPVRLQLDARTRQSARVEPVESRLVATSVDASGLTIAHIQFIAPCPMDLFQLAVGGSGSEQPRDAAGGSEPTR